METRARTTPSIEETRSANIQKLEKGYLPLLVSQNTWKNSPPGIPEVTSKFLGVPTDGHVPFLARGAIDDIDRTTEELVAPKLLRVPLLKERTK